MSLRQVMSRLLFRHAVVVSCGICLQLCGHGAMADIFRAAVPLMRVARPAAHSPLRPFTFSAAPPPNILLNLPWINKSPQRAAKKILSNGVTAIVRENHAASVVAVRMYVKTGSIYEGKWLGAGLSHLFEHTLGEGTSTRSKEQINALVAEVGGQSNAYTSKAETCYYITTASRYFEKTVDILSDELKNANFPEKEVTTQIGVIHNEMAMDDDDPDHVIYTLFDDTAWREHPNRLPIIGYRQIFDQLKRQDVLDYYHSRYVPDNTVVVVAGDVDTQHALDVLEKAFSDWERRPIPEVALPKEPPQLAPRRAVKEMDIQVAHILMGFHTIPISDPDLYPLDLLAMILGRGESSRLNVRIQQRARLVHSIAAWSDTPSYDAGYFGIKSVLDPDKINAAEKAILSEIDRLKTEFINDEELARAKRQNEASFIYSRQSAESQASLLASDELATGDIDFSQRYVANINKVTKQDLQRVARKYFYPENYTVVILKPRSAIQATAQKVERGKVGEIQKVALPNGMTLLLRENHTNPIINFIIAFYGGTRYETEANNGVSHLTAALLTRGTKSKTGEQIAQMMDAIGGSVDAYSGSNSIGVTAQVLKQDCDKGLDMLCDVLFNPTFPQGELDRLRSQALAALKQQEDDPFSRAILGVRRAVFQGHPYRFNAVGTRESLQKMTRQDLVNFYSRTMKPDGAVMAVFGDFDAVSVRRKIEDAFGKFQGKPVAVSVPPAQPLNKVIEETDIKPGIVQTVITMGFDGITLKDKDRYAVDVMNAALAGLSMPGGRLHSRLRDNQLVYVVHAFSQEGLEPGAFIIYAATNPKNKDEVIRILKEEVGKITSTPVTPDELARAKVMCITEHELGQESNASQAQQAAYNELYGLGYDDSRHYAERIEAVTLDDVLRVAQRILTLDKLATVVVEAKR